MKKISAVLLSFVLCVAMLLSVSAGYTFDKDERFSIELDDKFVYSQEQSTENIYIFNDKEAEGENVNINCIANTTNDSFLDYDEESLENYKKQFKKQMNSSYEDAGVTAEIDFYELKTQLMSNGLTALVGEVKTVLVNGNQNIELYQKLYQYAGEDTVFTVTYTVFDKEKLDDLDKTVDNMVINEEEAVSDDIKDMIFGIIVFVTVLTTSIVISVVNKKKKEKMKNQPLKSAYDPNMDLNSHNL